MSTLLTNRTPWKKEWCGRENCPPCKTKPGTCRTLNPVYRLSCIDCATNGKTIQYIGESSRSFWDRSRDHQQALETANQKYAVVKHWLQDHSQQEPPKFKFEIISSHQTAIARQISEGLEIEKADPLTLINGKGEYGSNSIPRFKMTINDEIVGLNQINPNPENTTCQNDEATINPKRANSDDQNYFSKQFSQRKRAKKEARASTESLISSDTQPSLKVLQSGMQQRVKSSQPTAKVPLNCESKTGFSTSFANILNSNTMLQGSREGQIEVKSTQHHGSKSRT